MGKIGTKVGASRKTKAPGRKDPHLSFFLCEEGDVVISGGKPVCVAQVVGPGKEKLKVRDCISVYHIYDGQVMTRSPRYIGQEGEHPQKRTRIEVKKPVRRPATICAG